MPLRDNDVALPHASLLAYFQRPAAAPRPSQDSTSPPPYDGQQCPLTPRLRHATLARYEDEEWKTGFWGEQASTRSSSQSPDGGRSHSRRCVYDIVCFISGVIVCILACFGVFFILGLLNRQFQLRAGHSLGNSNMQEMHFCLTSPNRQAPGPQTWRLTGKEECLTEKITLMVDASEQWKMRFDDEVVVRDDVAEIVPVSGDEF